jgi:hypothetical protein
VLLSTGTLKDYRACFGCVKRLARKGLCLDRDSAALLGVEVGDRVLAVAR